MNCDERTRCFAATCRSGGCGGSRGWAKAYSFSNGSCQALVCLYLIDVSNVARYSTYLPFLVDTGTPITIVPRPILQDSSAFQGHQSHGIREITGLGGRLQRGSRFRAALSISPSDDDCEPFALPGTEILVLDESELKHGLLGLDMLHRMVSVFDPRGVSFRRR